MRGPISWINAQSQKLTIIIPVYNEESTIAAVLARVHAVSLPLAREVIVVNDGSTDSTSAQIDRVRQRLPRPRRARHAAELRQGRSDRARRARRHRRHRGHSGCGPRGRSGRACQAARANPQRGRAGRLRLTVPGTTARPVGECAGESGPHDPDQYPLRRAHYRHGNGVQDGAPGRLRSPRPRVPAFRFRARDHRQAVAVWLPDIELPISYTPRSRQEGKKIKWQDGVVALRVLLRYRFVPFDRIVRDGVSAESAGAP